MRLCFSPPARWGLLDFIRAVLLLCLLTRRLLLTVQIPVGTAGPQPRLPSRSQWALPDLNRDFQIAVGTAGPQPRLPDRSGHCRTSTGRMWEKMSDRKKKICQTECQKECQKEFQKICQKECSECHKICQKEYQNICHKMMLLFGVLRPVAYLDISFQSCGVCSYICHGGDHSKWSILFHMFFRAIACCIGIWGSRFPRFSA